ncbi:hypothetical protein MB14_13225 [Roseivirga ehrenbergii]|uniref:Outer membrane protein beta-barrel domain-containing protein n=2 Tax=Roseivirga ehrenbergii (strain DSM 102268 / JCM 13514 / KCTC 12282 / NCIMB 14502 / KMM 6017) TaxID=279360 RepID=A0A150XSG6_ROSEK|nr:hypothetical protein MB14_13225 [Roseivirga ehrenbergii]
MKRSKTQKTIQQQSKTKIMKTTVLTIALLFIGFSAFAQEPDQEFRTIFNNNGIRSNGGYGAVTTGYSKIADRHAILMGGHGAWLINHQFGLGFGGTGFVTERKTDTQLNDRYSVAGGYGGLRMEFIAMPNSPIHLSFPILIGAGGVTYVEAGRDYEFAREEDSQAFFVTEAGAEIEINVIKFMRLSFGAHYRYTSDIDLTYLDTGAPIMDKDALRGLSGTISLKFGKF